MPKTKIIRIIPDKLFYRLWKSAESTVNMSEYIDIFMSALSKEYIDFHRKYKLDELQAINMLENIYKAAHLSVKDIINASGKRKAEIGYIFCIPIRTLEDWYYGKNKCPAYVRLMMIKKLGLLDLGRYIYLESDNHVVYNAYKGNRGDTEQKRVESVVPENVQIDDNIYRASRKNDYMMSMKEYEQLNVHNSNKNIRDIMAATDYLREYIKRNN